MRELIAENPSRTVRIFASFEEQERETIRYWNSRTIEEKLRATDELIEHFYRQKGIDVHAQGSNRSVGGLQRA